MITVSDCLVSKHWRRVREMMQRFGQATPDVPTIPDDKTCVLRARLILEEALETINKGLGIDVYANDLPLRFEDMDFTKARPADAVELVDGCCDNSVVNVGTLIAFGLPDEEPLRLVDANNLEKVKNGRVDENGKFQKHPDHQPPDIKGWLGETCAFLGVKL